MQSPFYTATDNEIAQYIKSVGHHAVLPRAEERMLLEKARFGSEEEKTAAIDKLVRHNQGLIIKIATKYKGKGVPLVDLVVEGNIGLMTAINKFDLDQDVKLSTYASWWIREKIGRCIQNEGRAIRLPVYQCEKTTKLRGAYMEYLNANGIPPTNEDLADITEIPLEDIEELFNYSILDPISLDTTTTSDDNRTVGDTLVCDEINPIDEISRQSLIKEVWAAINKLTEEEQFIIKNKFGLIEDAHTRSEVAEILNINEKTYRSLARRAVNKLAKELDGYARSVLNDLHGLND